MAMVVMWRWWCCGDGGDGGGGDVAMVKVVVMWQWWFSGSLVMVDAPMNFSKRPTLTDISITCLGAP